MLSSFRASFRLSGIDKVLRTFWCSGYSWTMYSELKTTRHLSHMGSGSSLMKNEWVKKICPILALAPAIFWRLFKCLRARRSFVFFLKKKFFKSIPINCLYLLNITSWIFYISFSLKPRRYYNYCHRVHISLKVPPIHGIVSLKRSNKSYL